MEDFGPPFLYMKEKHKNESVWMSYILRHGAKKENVPIDENGWVHLAALIHLNPKISETIIKEIVATDNKQRYSLSEDGSKIRANQGHSMKVDVQLEKKIPPVILYHGTSMQVIEEIKKHGVQKMTRDYVHLSEEIQTAFDVGGRHGTPVIITIDCKAMVADGITFYQSVNKVWLTDQVDPKYFKEIVSKHSFL